MPAFCPRSKRVRNLSRSGVEYELVDDLAERLANQILRNLGAILGPVGLHDAGSAFSETTMKPHLLPELLHHRPHFVGRRLDHQPALAAATLDMAPSLVAAEYSRSGYRRAARSWPSSEAVAELLSGTA